MTRDDWDEKGCLGRLRCQSCGHERHRLRAVSLGFSLSSETRETKMTRCVTGMNKETLCFFPWGAALVCISRLCRSMPGHLCTSLTKSD